jgi:outer membrane immunogenic protein
MAPRSHLRTCRLRTEHVVYATQTHMPFMRRTPVLKGIWTVGIVTLATAASSVAFAADLPVALPATATPVASPPPPPPPFGWTGLYIGGNVGAKWADTTWTATSLSDIAAKRIDASSPRDFNSVGLRAGGYLGYNWQFARQWVTGIEGDIAWADRTATAAGLPGCAEPIASTCVPAGFTSGPGPGFDLSSVKVGWDASVRARLGFLVAPQLLLYGTGGIAWQQLETSGACQHSAPDPLCLIARGNPFSTVTNSTVRTGWTAGGGLETNITGHWLARAEYRFSDFGTWNNVFNFNVPGETPGFDTYRFHLRATTQIATFGLAYKF